jgi:hypothetical protein
LRDKLGSGGQISCRKTHVPATAVTTNNPAGNEVIATEHRLNFIHATLFDQLPDSRTAYPLSLNQDGLDDTDAKTKLTAPTNQVFGISLASTTKSQVSSQPDPGQIKTLKKIASNKIFSLNTCKAAVKGLHDHRIHF